MRKVQKKINAKHHFRFCHVFFSMEKSKEMDLKIVDDSITISNMNSTSELPIEAFIKEANEDFTQHSQTQRDADRNQQSFYQAMQRKSIRYRYECCT